ncbi:MAG TPA: DEAD/DEAH box helicase, partial [Acetobacteraceae bacterium]|nr:DEAD/DEAH box helicase [Acetobacteraceae bacterium]
AGRLAFALSGAAFVDAYVLDDEGLDGSDWLDVMIEDVPALRREGWTVTVAEDFPVRVVEPDGDLEGEWREGSGIDWFELHLGVMVDGARVDLVPALAALLAGGHGAALVEAADEVASIPVPLEDGRLLMLPAARLRPILEALVELFAGGGIDPDAKRIGFSRLDAGELVALEERSGLVWQGAETARALGRQLRAGGGAIPPASLPASFAGTLRPYQAQGVAWLQFLRAAGLGGVLADDMGLGKTVQTLAHLAIEQAEGRLDRPALIVCPTSLVPNWTLEAARFAPTLKLLALHGPARRAQFGEIARHDIVLTTYPLLTRDHEILTSQEWHAVVLDEAQTIRNPNAETTRQALRLQARQRLCLSGTPLQNHLGELWSLFDFLAAGFLGSATDFRRRYRTPIEKHGDAARQEALTRRVRPFLLRRTKEEVAKDLPPKTEITEAVEMEAGQRAIYESVRLAMHAKVRAAIAERGLARSSIIILEALLRMRQACCDPRLLKLAAAQRGRAGSAKLERLMEMLATMRDEGRRVLLFSQFTSMLALIAERLDKERVPYVTLTGDTEDRATPVRRFQAGEVPLFLISLKAGGVGLNLTAADTVIHYDPWWNPAAEDQATDRAHRIGQTRHVFVHRLITLGTIEEKMEELKDRKRALVAAVLDAEHGGALRLTEDDVEALFAAA